MPFVLPSDPAPGNVAPASWGDAVRAGLSYLANPPACRIYNSANLSIPDSTETLLTFNSERYKTVASMHSTSTNTGRIVVPDAGIYRFSFRGALAAGNDYAAAYAILQLSSGTNIDKDEKLPGQFINGTFKIDCEYKMAAGDYVVLKVFQDNSANAARNIVASGQVSAEFSARWVGLGT